MSEQLQLSVVDQSPMREGSNAGTALRETIELAKATERLGYQRYWVAEHHNLPNFAGTAPEVMVGQIAAQTKQIRVGSGGVMLPHYSALKVAETFRILDSLYPDRIDLGIGRAPGSDQITAAALAYPSMPKDVRHFPQQVRDVINYLEDTQPDDHPFHEVAASPDDESQTTPQVWLLGSRYESAFMAAKMGLPFAYAHFFGMGATDGPQIVESYRQNFEASEYLAEPLVNVGVQVLCADTEEEAQRIASSRNLGRLRSVTGRAKGIPSPELAANYKYLANEWQFIQQYMRNCVDGDPEQVKAGLEQVAEDYQTKDLSVVTICYHFEDRVRSYELVAEVCGLEPLGDD
ncbi:MAG: LLM class flavin-dependent oxidoreductase [Chloroflexi bacterium]|nr:LLM class flavin-dependent oxidoreductase [Chloroflexota bacterium]